MLRSCGKSPADKPSDFDENSKFEQRDQLNSNSSSEEFKSRWIKLCNEGYKFHSGESFVEVKCFENHEWLLTNGNPIPRCCKCPEYGQQCNDHCLNKCEDKNECQKV